MHTYITLGSESKSERALHAVIRSLLDPVPRMTTHARCMRSLDTVWCVNSMAWHGLVLAWSVAFIVLVDSSCFLGPESNKSIGHGHGAYPHLAQARLKSHYSNDSSAVYSWVTSSIIACSSLSQLLLSHTTHCSLCTPSTSKPEQTTPITHCTE